MTKHGNNVAMQHAASLPAFSSLEEAERFLFQLRDSLRDQIERLANRCGLLLDGSPDSLKTLEKWYLNLCLTDGFSQLGLTKEEFQRCMGFYSGFVYTENCPEFTWIIQESPFIAGKFEIGVTKGLYTRMVGPISGLERLKHNKRMESMYREYQKWTSPAETSPRRTHIKGRKGNKPCPDCGKPLRTNQARQCFECGAAWNSEPA